MMAQALQQLRQHSFKPMTATKMTSSTTNALARSNDEFDKYFNRAPSEDSDFSYVVKVTDVRRPSLPAYNLMGQQDRLAKRTAKYPPRQKSTSESAAAAATAYDDSHASGDNDDEEEEHVVHKVYHEEYTNGQSLSNNRFHGNRYQGQSVAMQRTPSREDDADGSDERAQSAPQSRSSSWRKATRPSRAANGGRPSLGCGEELGLATAGTGRRRESVPLERVVCDRLAHLRHMYEQRDMCVVRHFASCKKGKAGGGTVVCRGDSFKKRSGGDLAASQSANNCSSTGTGSGVGREAERRRATFSHGTRVPATGTATTTDVVIETATKGEENFPFKVLVLGDQGVGKTALIQQFMTSEYMGAVETSTDEYSDEKTLSIQLDGRETMISITEVSVNKNIHDCDDADAYVIVFSMADRESYDFAVSLLDDLELERDLTRRRPPAIILVGNKNDIVRSRQVTPEEVHDISCRYRCKMIDLSASLNHRVDELLVGIVQQVRLHYERCNSSDVGDEKACRNVKAVAGGRKGSLLKSAAKELVQRLLRRESLKGWSPNNLQTL